MRVRRNYGRYTEVVTIEEFAQMDFPLSTPNYAGVYDEHTTVLIPSSGGTLALVKIARGKDGYHVSSEFETQTGFSGFWPSKNSKPWKDKTDAFVAGVMRLEKEWNMGFSKRYSDQACEIYFDAIHKQLTLF